MTAVALVVFALAVMAVLVAVFARPFINGLVTIEHDIFSRAQFVPYDLATPDAGYPIHMERARESFAAGLYARPPFDEHGIPVTDYRWTRQAGIPAGRHYNPGRVALYALEGCFVPWLTSGSAALLNDFRVQALWLRDHQNARGEYIYDFEHLRFAKQPGWISAWAQGLATSALVRAYLLFGEQPFLDAARRAASPLLRRVQDGGVLWVDDTGSWLEEVPEDPPSHILNGFITAWYALVDLEAVSPDPAITAVRAACADTLAQHAARYGSNGVLLYDLKRRGRASLGYPRLQIAQMRSMGSIVGAPAFTTLAEAWEVEFGGDPNAGLPRRWLRAAWWAFFFRRAQLRDAFRPHV